MQTKLADFIKDTPHGREADAILRNCVHCGFCTATCPTYQLLGDELDGPRGRIYLIKQVLEGAAVSSKTQLHLDRCLTCRACETTCPSGVLYGRLVEIGREVVDEKVRRPAAQRLIRRLLRLILPYYTRFGPLLRMGQLVRPMLPRPLRRKVPPPQSHTAWMSGNNRRKFLTLNGCAQRALAPGIDAATARVLNWQGVSFVAIEGTGCCGAVSHHLSAPGEALDFMRRNIDAWWPHIEAGAEAIVITASACAGMVKDYGDLLKDDTAYAAKATRVSAMTRDLSEALAAEDLSDIKRPADGARKIAFHAPCTLQHGQKINGVVERILKNAGFELTPVPDAHLCCGSAGTYSILQLGLSQRLLENKLKALGCGRPDAIATANVGCLAHLQTAAEVPVVHWIELLNQALEARNR